MTNEIQLPPISDEDRQHLSYNPNTDDLVEWVESQMYAAVAAALAQQAARHAEELDAYALTVSNRDAEISTAPAWHDAPTCDGRWLRAPGYERDWDLMHIAGSYIPPAGSRWFGPISEDSGGKT